MKFEIDTDQIKVLSDEAGKLFLDPSIEDKLVRMYQVRDLLDQIIEAAKLRIEVEAIKLQPEFSSIKGDRVKVMYRNYGARYKIDESMLEIIPKELYKTKVSVSADPDAIDSYIESHDGKVPAGIIEAERNKQVSITIKKDEVDTPKLE